MFSPRALISLNEPIICDSSDHDLAGPEYLSRGADLTGSAASKSGVFSCWCRLDDTVANFQRILCNTKSDGNSVTNFLLEFDNNGRFTVTQRY